MKTKVLGVNIDCLKNSEALKRVLDIFQENRRQGKIIVTVNPEMILAAKSDKGLMEVFEKAELVIPDGIGVVLASRLNKVKIAERVTGCDLVFSIFDAIKDTPYTVYILGAGIGVAETAKASMEKKFPGLKICGTHHGFFDELAEKRIIEEISALKPDLLLAGLGLSRQEKWLYKNKDLPVNISIGVGGTIDVMAGKVKRAPKFFQKMGLEWLYRLLKEPSRFFRMLALPKFAVMVVLSKLGKQF